MASTGDVAAQIRAACKKAEEARTALEQAEDLAEEAHNMLARALEGANHLESDVAAMLAAFTSVRDGFKGHLWPLTTEVLRTAEGIAARLEGENATPTVPGGSRSAQPPQRPPGQQLPAPPPVRPAEPSEPPVIPPERIEGLRRELPPPVVPNSGQKTHGRWITPDGEVRPLVSGYDELLEECEKAFPDLGLRRGLPNIAAHVETKLAAYMRNHNARAATLIINNWPCEDGPLTCEQVVPALLPEGHTLTVYGPNGFRKTYRGGATPPWRKR